MESTKTTEIKGFIMSISSLLRMKRFCVITGLSRGAVYNLMKYDPTFPKPIKIGQRAIAFSEQAVQDWIADKIKSAV